MQRLGSKFAVYLLIMTVANSCGSEHRMQVEVPPSAEISIDSIDINTANNFDLQRIPYIGEKLAAEIVVFRQKHGPFRRPEHLMLINGISDRRFREIRHLIRVN